MNILFFGDVHGNFRHVLPAVQAHKPEAIVFLGDLQAQRPLHIELDAVRNLTDIYYIHGNHDTDSEADHDHLFASELADRNLHGRVVEVAGIRIAGLGGVFREKVWSPGAEPKFVSPEDFIHQAGKGNLWRQGLPLKQRSSIFYSDYFELHGQRADVLVTHEAPGAHPHGFAIIDELARSMGVTRLYHGHQHDRLDYTAANAASGFCATGVGLRGITDLQGQVIRPGELDEKRMHRNGWL